MYYGAAEPWNLRDRHMFETLQAVLAARGPDTRAVGWTRNSHIGHARATEMRRIRDELNIGQLRREASSRTTASAPRRQDCALVRKDTAARPVQSEHGAILDAAE